MLYERRLERAQMIRCSEALAPFDPLALGINREHHAGVDWLAVRHHGAAAARASVADFLRAGQVEVVSKGVQQRRAWLDVRVAHLTVDLDADAHRAFEPSASCPWRFLRLC